MPPELIDAIKERLELNYTDEAIQRELEEAGYDAETITAAIQAAKTDAAAGAETITPIPPSTKLPGVTELLKQSFRFVFDRYDLWLVLAVPLMLLTAYGLSTGEEPSLNETLTANVLAIVFFFLQLWLTLSILHVALESGARKVPLRDALAFAGRHFFAFLWVYLLTMFAVLGGFLLFVIPGIIVALYVYFAQYVFAAEGMRGVDALMRSRALVRGNWLALAGRFLQLILVFVAVLFILGVVAGLALTFAVDAAVAEWIAGLGGQVVSAILTVLGLHIGTQLYGHLAASRPPATTTDLATGRTKYRVLVGLGLIVPLIGLFASVLLASLNEARQQGEAAQQQFEQNAKERALELREEDGQAQ